LRFRRAPDEVLASISEELNPLQDRMIRYRYGPWDPSYYAVLGSLIGRGLVTAIPASNGIGYRTTDLGRTVAATLASDDAWADIQGRTKILKRHLDYSGTSLKNWLYEAVPEMTQAGWHEEL
jgi:hypothetical protein